MQRRSNQRLWIGSRSTLLPARYSTISLRLPATRFPGTLTRTCGGMPAGTVHNNNNNYIPTNSRWHWWGRRWRGKGEGEGGGGRGGGQHCKAQTCVTFMPWKESLHAKNGGGWYRGRGGAAATVHTHTHITPAMSWEITRQYMYTIKYLLCTEAAFSRCSRF